MHPYRRGRPQDRSGHQEKLPPQLQHRQGFAHRLFPVTYCCPLSDVIKRKLQSSPQVCCTEPSASSFSTARRSCCSSRGRTPRSLFQVGTLILKSCRLASIPLGRAATLKAALVGRLYERQLQCRRGGVWVTHLIGGKRLYDGICWK